MICNTFSLSWFLPAAVEIGLVSYPIPETASSLDLFCWRRLGGVVGLHDEHGSSLSGFGLIAVAISQKNSIQFLVSPLHRRTFQTAF